MISGDVTRLVGLLRDDAVSDSDDGGKASAALNPIVGADRVARFFLGLARKGAGTEPSWEIKDAAGTPSLWLSWDGRLQSLINLALDENGLIQTVLVIRNPDKLPAV